MNRRVESANYYIVLEDQKNAHLWFFILTSHRSREKEKQTLFNR